MRSPAALGGLMMAVVLAVLTACGPASPGADEKITTLRIAINSAPDSLNPALASGSGQFIGIPLSLTYDALFHQTPSGEIEPQLAAEWAYDNSGPGPDNRVFELTLREGVKFSDGESLTAEAVVKWLRYFVKGGGVFSANFGANPRFTATGPLSVRIEMAESNPALPTILSDAGNNAGFVVSPAAVDNPSLMDKGSYGTGQYRLEASASVNGDHYTYTPNANYYNKPAVRFEKVYIKVIENASSRLQAQQSGQYDVAIGDVSTADAAKSAGFDVRSAPLGMFFLSMDLVHDVGAPELKDVRVRQAINYAINREKIAEGLFGEHGVPRWGFVTADPKSDDADFHYAYDPAKAKELLAEAGHADGFSLDLICSGYYGTFGEPAMNAVAQNLKDVGIDTSVTCYPDLPSFGAAVFEFENALIQTLDQLAVTPVSYQGYLAKAAPLAFYGGDPEVDRLYRAGAASADPAAHWDKMWHRYTSQAYVVPLIEFPLFFYVSDGIGGVEVSDVHSTSLPTSWFPTGK